MRSVLVRLVRFLVGLFYRRIEIAGKEHVPREGPVLFVANHNNGLVDPMIVLYSLSRPIVFVAKSTLWKIPVLRSLLDLLGCVPVVRKGEGEPGISLKGEERNSAAFERLAAVLQRDGAVLIFPEGRSHSDPRLSEIRTGAARVLLLSRKSPVVVPVGLWFSQKEIFRSDVLVKFGATVSPPAAGTVEAWTEAMGAALASVTLNADDWKDHEIVAAVDALYGKKIGRDFFEGEEGEGQLGKSLRIRQLLVSAQASLEKTNPGEVASLVRRVRAMDHLLRRISLSFSSFDDPPPASTILWHTLKALAVIALGFPVAVLGVTAWWAPYRLCGIVANRIPASAKERDQVALYKLLAGLVLFPVFLVFECAAVWLAAGPLWAVLAAVALPFAGISSLLLLEYATWREGQARELLALVLAPGAIARLKAERDALVAECDRLAGVFTGTADNPAR
ncbi:MAG: 1-acyl-sn-glycerol-3-phosphate acyltransferase [Thermoanaerobaculia bacterium]|nr:1-acyl-sn-glycerol-3-phosphate acyltransferase [Thermoanaerobaculia bacterium]